MLQLSISVAALVLATFLSGCGRDNGLARDLVSHLKASGISIQPSRVHAPLSERGGYLLTRYDAQVAAKIISAFALNSVPTNDARWLNDTSRVRGSIVGKELWGASGRPSQFKLKSGGQLEYFYLVVTPDGEMYLFAEYAYG